MKTYFVIEADTNMHNLFVYAVEKTYVSTGIAYTRKLAPDADLIGLAGPKFYGKLDALLITELKIAKAAPIEPLPVEVESGVGLVKQ